MEQNSKETKMCVLNGKIRTWTCLQKREPDVSFIIFFEGKTRDTRIYTIRIKCVIIFPFLFKKKKKEKNKAEKHGRNSTAIQLHDSTIIIRRKL